MIRTHKGTSTSSSANPPIAKPLNNFQNFKSIYNHSINSQPDPSTSSGLEQDTLDDFRTTIEQFELFPDKIAPIPRINLKQGCYRISYIPNSPSLFTYSGTMRVDKTENTTTVSGDLYSFSLLILEAALFSKKSLSVSELPIFEFFPGYFKKLGIPIYPRKNYNSYLQVTDINFVWFPKVLFKSSKRNLSIINPHIEMTIDEWVYNKPIAGSFNGSFDSAPARTIKVLLYPKAAPSGYSGPYFEGSVYEGRIKKGKFTMGWVSKYFRKAKIEMDSVTGTTVPQSVPNAAGTENEDIRTAFQDAGWDVMISVDQTNLQVPTGQNTNNCWPNATSHAFMLNNRNPNTNLDKEWKVHLFSAPAGAGCFFGIIHDQIGDHREGSVVFPNSTFSNNTNFGTAAGQQLGAIARAYLRTAIHEIGHAFNLQHTILPGQPPADNSIMTQTGPLGNVIANAGGTFPGSIILQFNDNDKHHLNHFPDPAIRPGAMNWQAGYPGLSSGVFAPEADVDFVEYGIDELELKLTLNTNQIKLGEPLPLTWKIMNNSKETISIPDEISLESQHAYISVIDPDGNLTRVTPFTIEEGEGNYQNLESGKESEAKTNLFWSSFGFAFKKPGRHIVDVTVAWQDDNEITRGVKQTTSIWVDYPISDEDNKVASLLLDNQVGMLISLGGEAPHLKEATYLVKEAMSKYTNHPACKCIEEIKRQNKPNENENCN